MSEEHTAADHGGFGEELRLLAEQLLERVEPSLRRTAGADRAAMAGCSWCPICAAAALLRGDHHQVLSALADHGTAMVVILREALAGTPVEPRLPVDDTAVDHAAADETAAPARTEPKPAPAEVPDVADAVRFVNIPVTIRS
ncbi:hypothetical protein [Antrihabitans cavernicola]|uniref:hypothetical protein n=1 Tax=Antrihabitans cavernicola TaxID=2495913 RepID=UPI001659F5C0|nr:hypothetical protein [Spelaeibacter cavernicola]